MITLYSTAKKKTIRKSAKKYRKNFYFEIHGGNGMSKDKMIQEIIRMLKKGSWGKVLLIYNFALGVYSVDK